MSTMTNPQSSIVIRAGRTDVEEAPHSRESRFSLAVLTAALPFGLRTLHAPQLPPRPTFRRPACASKPFQPRAANTEEVVGTVQSRHAVDIAAKISGRILELPVVLGQSVEEGDLLVAMDSQEIQARLEQAEVALRQAEIDYRRVESLRRPARPPSRKRLTPPPAFHSARAAVAEAKAMLEDARITAPIDGVVARKERRPGRSRHARTTAVAARRPAESAAGSRCPGFAVLDRVPAGASSGADRRRPRTDLEGKVIEIAPVADPATRSLRVKLDLPPPRDCGPVSSAGSPCPGGGGIPGRAHLDPGHPRGQLDILFVAVDGKARMRIVRTAAN
jgi:multidrug efflux pump subunit AcrA (membrane-fusion protein)